MSSSASMRPSRRPLAAGIAMRATTIIAIAT
jgi:hypothetical protein